jgi:hypothetical protein
MFGDVNDSVGHFLFFCARNTHAVQKSHSQVAKQPGSQADIATKQLKQPAAGQPGSQMARWPGSQARIETIFIPQINNTDSNHVYFADDPSG